MIFQHLLVFARFVAYEACHFKGDMAYEEGRARQRSWRTMMTNVWLIRRVI
ncbi:hypothetical protein Hanom_Chr10g00880101 [Helianthus anomalus]